MSIAAGPLEIGVCHPAPVEKIDSVELFARTVARHEGARFWMGQSLGVETFATMSYLAGAGYRIPMGTCVGLVTLRTAAESASLCRSMVELTGRSFVYGMGVGSRRFRSGIGVGLHAPATYAARNLAEVRERLAAMPGLDANSVVLGLGVLRTAMAAKSGDADRLVTWMCPPSHLSDNLLPTARVAAGSRRPPSASHVLHVALRRPNGPDPRDLALRAFSAHLTGEHYRRALGEAGFGDVAVMTDRQIGTALVDSRTFLYGTSEEVTTHLGDLHAAGCSEIALNVGASVVEDGLASALADLDVMLGASSELTLR